MTRADQTHNPDQTPKRRPGRPRLTEPSPEYIQRLDDIIEAGVRVFHDKGYDAGTLDDVAAALDLRRASLYHYLRSKGQLLYLIFDRVITTALARLDTLAAIGDPQDQLAAFITHQVRMVAKDPDLFAVAFDQRDRLEPEFSKKILHKEREYVRRVTAMIHQANVSSARNGLALRPAAHALIGMTTWTYKWYDPTRDNADDIARTMIALTLGEDVK